MSLKPLISHFSPQRTDPETLERMLVQRHRLLADSVEKLRESVLTGNKHHLLFIGPRGAGKTHLITLIHHRLSRQTDLGERLRFAWLNEDETSTSFLKLLIRIYRDLTQRYPAEFPEADLQAIYGRDADLARDMLGRALLAHLRDRTVVVLVENLDALFGSMPEAEQRTWRAFVQNHPVFAFAGTAQSLFDGVSDRDEPFFGFFDTIHLKTLSVEEATDLLVRLAEINGDKELADFLGTPRGRARLRAMHHLSGGNPRLYIIFSDFLTKESLDDLVRPFQETVDKQLTAYYQERLRWLSAQQQEIVQLLCRATRPIPVKDIAEGIFAAHNTVTSQLKQLRQKCYVSPRPVGREVLYELAEPLMRLSYQVKETNNRQPLTLIVDFLRVWYDRKEIEERMGCFTPGSDARVYFEAALEKLITEGNSLRLELLRTGLENTGHEICDSDMLDRLYCVAVETGMPEDWLALGMAYIKAGRGEEPLAMESFGQVISSPKVSASQKIRALFERVKLLLNAGQFTQVIFDLNMIINHQPIGPNLLAGALTGRGALAYQEGNQERADADFAHALALHGVNSAVKSFSLLTRARFFYISGHYEKVIADCTRLIRMRDAPEAPRLEARVFLGFSFIFIRKSAKAEAEFTKVISLPDEDGSAHACSFWGRGLTRAFLDRPEEAVDDIETLLDSQHREVLKKIPSYHSGYLASATPAFLLKVTTEKFAWETLAPKLTWAVREVDQLTQLGQTLVGILAFFFRSSPNPEILDRWVNSWVAAGEEVKEFQFHVRMLQAGIEWIKTRDDSALLVLAKEERQIVRDALDLPPEGQ